MKVVCKVTTVGQDKSLHLTVGKTYDILKVAEVYDGMPGIVYKIKNDIGTIRMYSSSKFDTLDFIRGQKLNELGI